MDTGLRNVASIWFQCVVPMPLAPGPMMTWPTLSPRPSLLLSATVTRRDRSWGEGEMQDWDQQPMKDSPWPPGSQAL
ncbi:rCG47679 [Rattus norvegicus]|uniref:RCG47679 n=1 Tax=Rattus norvegicus TaxID=10116 RepID=A6HYX6_RAT|nr:rCG47679 [Rattus norvegicus]